MTYNRRIEHATIATVTNNRFTTRYTLDIRPEKPNSIINSAKIHQQIFEAIKKMDESTTTITHDNNRTTNSNTSPTDEEHNNAFPDQRTYHLMYLIKSASKDPITSPTNENKEHHNS